MERLTLEEAIAHAKKITEKNYRGAEFESIDSIDDDIKTNCIKCAEEHEQLAEWLEEVEKIMTSPVTEDCFGEECRASDCTICLISKAIEIVKGGGVE